MKGTVIKKENSLWIRYKTSIEGDDVFFEDFPLSIIESKKSFKIGEEVLFKTEKVEYTDLDGYGVKQIKWAIIL
jgi:hypothetical protein